MKFANAHGQKLIITRTLKIALYRHSGLDPESSLTNNWIPAFAGMTALMYFIVKCLH
jgi:hypothetical protein